MKKCPMCGNCEVEELGEKVKRTMRMLRDGCGSPKNIADELGLNYGTVRNQLKVGYRALGLNPASGVARTTTSIQAVALLLLPLDHPWRENIERRNGNL